MATQTARIQYRLPCTCGQTVLVDRSQAGILVRCQCGHEIEVPTIRALGKLETVAVEQPRTHLGNRKALLIVGLVLAGCGFGLGALRQFFPPRYPFSEYDVQQNVAASNKAIDDAPAAKTFELWKRLELGLDQGELAELAVYRARVADNQRWMWTMYALGTAGLLTITAGFLFTK